MNEHNAFMLALAIIVLQTFIIARGYARIVELVGITAKLRQALRNTRHAL